MKKNTGFTLIEIIIAIGLSMIFLPAILKVFSFSIQESKQGEEYTKAYTLAQEGMDVIFALKESEDTSWNWTSTPLDGVYQPTKSGSVWSLGSPVGSPTITESIFTRTVTIASAERCGPDSTPCESGGTIDLNLRKAHVLVNWLENGQPAEIEMDAYVTKH